MRNSLIALMTGVALAAMPAALDARGAGQQGSKAADATRDDLKDTLSELRDAATVARKMKAQPEASRLLAQSKGVLLVPDFGKGAFVVGGSGGQGVLVPRQNGKWGNPVFYNLGSISLGAQAGAEGGQIAMILMSDRAVNSFKGNNTFSIDAKAGLTIVNYSAKGDAGIGKGDVIIWSDTEGAFAGAEFSASTISADEEANRAYYGTANARPGAIIAGSVSKARPEAAALHDALSS